MPGGEAWLRFCLSVVVKLWSAINGLQAHCRMPLLATYKKEYNSPMDCCGVGGWRAVMHAVTARGRSERYN